ncbi:hypothetical protein Tco_0468700 [Tanacetum coccineum]
MTRRTVKKLTKPLEEPNREICILRNASRRPQQNESLAIVGRDLFDDEASSSFNSEPKINPPAKTLREHSHPNSFGFQSPIIFPMEQTRKILDSHDVWLIQATAKGGMPTKEESPISLNHKIPQSPTIYYPLQSSSVPFLSWLKKQKKDDEDEKFLSIFKHIHINLPFLEVVFHMPKEAKVLKDLLSHKGKLEKVASLVKLSK